MTNGPIGESDRLTADGKESPRRDEMMEALDEAQAERERPNTLVVPAGWGSGNPDISQMDIVFMRGHEILEARVRVDAEIRQRLEGAGVAIREVRQVEPAEHLSANEASIASGFDDQQLSRELADITPEVKAIPTQKYAEFAEQPYYPVVAYHDQLAGGAGKYLLESPEQFERLQEFFTLDAQTEDMRGHFLFKKFIETPSDHFTSYRVVADATGGIIAAGLLGSSELKGEETRVVSDAPMSDIEPEMKVGVSWFAHLEIPDSPLFLNARRMTSNATGGGTVVPLDPGEQSRPITAGEHEILEAHGINDQRLPEQLRQGAKAIAEHLGPGHGLVYSFDFIQDKEGNFYFLEGDTGPEMRTINAVLNQGRNDEEAGYRLLMSKAVTAVFGGQPL